MFRQTAIAVTKRLREESWGNAEEMQALTVEHLSALLVATINANSKRPTKLRPMTIPRPNRPQEPKARMVGHGDIARMIGGAGG